MVEIPDDVAKQIATVLRAEHYAGSARGEWADLLDPQPPTLREQVARAICADGWDSCHIKDFHEQDADAVLAVVADWLAAQPLVTQHGSDVAVLDQRDHDVRLLRGES